MTSFGIRLGIRIRNYKSAGVSWCGKEKDSLYAKEKESSLYIICIRWSKVNRIKVVTE